MLSSVGLEVMNSTNPELNWKIVTKGRRSRKSVARSLNSVVKVGNCISPKRVGDFLESDSDKFGEVVLGQSTSGKSENVPLKKKRHLLQSPQPHPLASSLRRQDSASSGPLSSSPLSENHDQVQYHSCSSGLRSSSWHLRGVEGSLKVGGGDGSDGLCNQTESEYNLAGEFSGIELLAAAASMDDDLDNADKNDPLDISMQKNPDASSSATLSKVSRKTESEDLASNMKVYGSEMDTQQKNSVAASKSLCGSPEDDSMPKVSRHHWDLNTLMDAWEEPSDDLIAGDAAKEVRHDIHMEGQKDSRDHVYSNPGGTRDESSDLKIEVNNSSSVSGDRICSEYPNVRGHLQEQQKNMYFNASKEVSEQAGEKDLDDGNSIQVLNSDADMKKLNEYTSSDAVLDISPFTKLCCTSSMLMSEEKANSIPGTVAIMQDEDCSSNVSECERGTVGEICNKTQDVNSHHLTVSESHIGISCKDAVDCRKSSELLGTFALDVQPVLIADSNKQNDGMFISGSKIGDHQGLFKPTNYDARHEVDDHPYGGLKSLEDTFKTCSSRAQTGNPTTSTERIDSLIDARHVSDNSQDNNNNMHIVGGDDLTQQGYDSPYEDGELRGSFFAILEDNEMENECVDYESDGRNGDGSDAADCLGSEIVEGDSESSHGTRRNLSLKVSPESTSKSAQVKHSRKHSVQDDSDNNEIAGKGSNAGSGTTVEQCMGMGVEEQHDMKRRQLLDRRDTIDEKVTDIYEYASKMMVRGKLQSRIEGRSSAEATNRKDVFFTQQCRPRRFIGSYSRTERDFSPDRYMGRYNRSTPHGERDGVHQSASWGSRKRYASNYQGPDGCYPTRPRNKINESFDGVDFPDPGQTAHYLSKGPHRPLLRRSPVERDEYLGVGRRIAPTRGVGNYRSRGHYSQRVGRDYMEDFEPLPDDAVRMPRYISRRDRSFSPSSGRSSHMALPRRRSHSRSRTRSPRPWHPQRERIFGTRKHSRTPEIRSERMRLPFSKPSSDYGEDYIRWVDDRNFVDTRRRRSPVRVFRRNQRFDDVGPSIRLKSDDYFRHGRFSLMGNGDDRKRGEMMHHRALQDSDERRFRRNAAGDDDDFQTNNLNDEKI